MQYRYIVFFFYYIFYDKLLFGTIRTPQYDVQRAYIRTRKRNTIETRISGDNNIFYGRYPFTKNIRLRPLKKVVITNRNDVYQTKKINK
jgi:hypothetical protein